MTTEKQKTPRTEMPVFSSLANCAGVTGIPLATLKAAKRAGAPGFDQSGRVHLEQVLPWLFRSDDTLKSIDWHARLKRAQALRAELETSQKRGQLLDAATVAAQLGKGAAAMKARIFEIVTSAPVKLAAAGEDIATNRGVLSDVLWGAFEGVRDAMSPYLEELDAHTRTEAQKILNPPTDEKTEGTKARAHDARGDGAQAASGERPSGGSTGTGNGQSENDRPDVGGRLSAEK